MQCVHITRTVEIKKYMLETLKFELLAVDQFVAEVHCYLNSITGLGQTAFIWGSAKFKDMFLLSLDL